MPLRRSGFRQEVLPGERDAAAKARRSSRHFSLPPPRECTNLKLQIAHSTTHASSFPGQTRCLIVLSAQFEAFRLRTRERRHGEGKEASGERGKRDEEGRGLSKRDEEGRGLSKRDEEARSLSKRGSPWAFCDECVPTSVRRQAT